MDPAIFLDRDGVIVENRPAYVRSWSDVYIFPQALEALSRISATPYKIVIVTNQSGIGRGMIPTAAAAEINQRLVAEIARTNGRIDGIYLCPHKPEDGCDCRKPLPGLLLTAARELSLDLSRSILIGDALTDLQAGQAAGLRQVALVRTGRGAAQEQLLSSWSPPELAPIPVYDTLSAALADLVP